MSSRKYVRYAHLCSIHGQAMLSTRPARPLTNTPRPSLHSTASPRIMIQIITALLLYHVADRCNVCSTRQGVHVSHVLLAARTSLPLLRDPAGLRRSPRRGPQGRTKGTTRVLMEGGGVRSFVCSDGGGGALVPGGFIVVELDGLTYSLSACMCL